MHQLLKQMLAVQVRGDGVPGGHENGNAAEPLPRMGDCPGRDSPPGRHVVDVRHGSWKAPLVGGSDDATTLLSLGDRPLVVGRRFCTSVFLVAVSARSISTGWPASFSRVCNDLRQEPTG